MFYWCHFLLVSFLKHSPMYLRAPSVILYVLNVHCCTLLYLLQYRSSCSTFQSSENHEVPNRMTLVIHQKTWSWDTVDIKTSQEMNCEWQNGLVIGIQQWNWGRIMHTGIRIQLNSPVCLCNLLQIIQIHKTNYKKNMLTPTLHSHNSFFFNIPSSLA